MKFPRVQVKATDEEAEALAWRQHNSEGFHLAMASTGRPLYMGEVSAAVKARRRAKNKAARKARRAAR